MDLDLKDGRRGLDRDPGRERTLLVWKGNKYISGRREPLLHYFLFENQVYFSGGSGPSSLSSVEVNAKKLYVRSVQPHNPHLVLGRTRPKPFSACTGQSETGINLS